jgi:hypothetical protein
MRRSIQRPEDGFTQGWSVGTQWEPQPPPFFFTANPRPGAIVRVNYDFPIRGHRAAIEYRNDVPK